MALEVEDGTAKSNAESYISVVDADDYHYLRGNDDWDALTTTQREQALRKASEFMLGRYRLRWKGSRISAAQALDWPRGFVERTDFRYGGLNGMTVIGGDFYYPSDEVPFEVQRACALLALKSLDGDLEPDLAPPLIRERVDVIENEWAPGARQTVKYEAVDNLLAPFLKGSGNMIPVVRA